MSEIKIQLSENARQTMERVRTLPDDILLGIAAAMDLQNQFTISDIVQRYLSFPKDGPSVPIGLRVQTGRGRSSVRASQAVISGQSVISSIGSDLDYMKAHEFGATIPAHTVTATNAKALRFRIGDRIVFAKSARIPEIQLPARGMIQRGIQDALPDYADAISAEIVKLGGEK